MNARAWWVFGILTAFLIGVVYLLPKQISTFARAIAAAEGWGTPGAIPTVRNNPGDLKLDPNDDQITTFATLEEGWAALEHQLSLVRSGSSSYYTPDMTIAAFAETWTGDDNAAGWAATVVQYLNLNGYAVSTSSPVSTVL